MKKIEEFWYCVSSQYDLPLYEGEQTKKISNRLESLINLVEEYKNNKDLKLLILADPEVISIMRELVGISDKRLYLDLTYIVNYYEDNSGGRLVTEERKNLIKHDTNFFKHQLKMSDKREKFAEIISDYFSKHGVIDMLNTFTSLRKDEIIQIYNNLIAPKEVQQMQAKYRGHGAEQAFAEILHTCGVELSPPNKHIDPMGQHDPNVDLATMEIIPRNRKNESCHSFDLIVKNNNEICILVQSLIHSSDPGQYGVNKSDETEKIANQIKDYNNCNNRKVYLLGCIDGVGFCENPNGTLVKMMDCFDDFVQMHTLFKIPIFLQSVGLIDNVIGIIFDSDYFHDEVIRHFCENYLDPCKIKKMSYEEAEGHKMLKAGKATVIFR